MRLAKEECDNRTGCVFWPTGAVVQKNGKIIGRGANVGDLQQYCPRIQKNAPTGTGYEDCFDVCKQISHAEIAAIDNCLENNNNPQGGDLYLFGHWWCCKPCWDHIIKHGIKDVYLLDDAHYIFTREKRYELMKKFETITQQGGKINLSDVAWTLTKIKI